MTATCHRTAVALQGSHRRRRCVRLCQQCPDSARHGGAVPSFRTGLQWPRSHGNVGVMSTDGEVPTGASGRDYTVKTSAKGIDYVRGVLRERATVTTQAVFWKIPRSSGHSDLSLNLGRYRRRSGDLQPVRDSPKSELTLDSEELTALIEFVADNVEPLATGAPLSRARRQRRAAPPHRPPGSR
jgi:hypothetical protein